MEDIDPGADVGDGERYLRPLISQADSPGSATIRRNAGRGRNIARLCVIRIAQDVLETNRTGRQSICGIRDAGSK